MGLWAPRVGGLGLRNSVYDLGGLGFIGHGLMGLRA